MSNPFQIENSDEDADDVQIQECYDLEQDNSEIGS